MSSAQFNATLSKAQRSRQGRLSRLDDDDDGFGTVLQGLEVYNSVEVKTSSIDVDSEGLPLAGKPGLRSSYAWFAPRVARGTGTLNRMRGIVSSRLSKWDFRSKYCFDAYYRI